MTRIFWGRRQTELPNRKHWKTRIELANAIFDYLEIFYNRQRRHSALGMGTPIEFELFHQSAQPWPETKYGDTTEPGPHQSLQPFQAIQCTPL
ncbi:hypothetical protein BOO86_23930 [Mycobacterium sp. CBMA 234]|uniref:IS3 family transposase n=1 Tax=Mycolicibacterium sp. CBMA 234 TaxID=1918495 RepID=UPI0012DC6880|nr:IS3 family transposase [Mycolicibacterium sp. CBMA 234]MUL67542.1 hypothetical protein [Mycolicibacterium sp. CBMA 234]